MELSAQTHYQDAHQTEINKDYMEFYNIKPKLKTKAEASALDEKVASFLRNIKMSNMIFLKYASPTYNAFDFLESLYLLIPTNPERVKPIPDQQFEPLSWSLKW